MISRPGGRIFFCFIILFVLCGGWAGAGEEGVSAAGLETTIKGYVAACLEWNPRLARERAGIDAQLARHAELFEFYDPALTAGAGVGEKVRSVPEAVVGHVYPDKAVAVSGGIRLALEPGLYLHMGGQQDLLWDDPVEDELARSTLGVQVEIPLLRDRLFRQFDYREQLVLAAVAAARGGWREEGQRLEREVSDECITVCEAWCQYLVSQAAWDRVTRILGEARQRVRLKVIPEYQVYHAQLEVGLRAEEMRAAHERYEAALERLVELCGVRRNGFEGLTLAELMAWAGQVELTSVPREQWLTHRGIMRSLAAELAAIEAVRRALLEDERGDLSLIAGVIWQGETGTDWGRDGGLWDDDSGGGMIQLRYRRPLGFRGAKARLRGNAAQRRGVEQTIRNQIAIIESALARAIIRFQSSRERLILVSDAVENALLTVKAEEERFKLGEGLSRNVLDAEKDLTDALRRQVAVATELLRARIEYLYQAGLFFAAPGLQDGEG